GNLIRHMQLHDPESKNSLMMKQEGSFDHSQLIDDEYYEDEDEEAMETDAEGGNSNSNGNNGNGNNTVSIVTADGTGAALLEGGAEGETIAITLDPQTQQLINSGNEQVM